MKKVFPALVVFLFVSVVFAETTLEKTDYGYDVKNDGRLFASYRADAYDGMPIVWPIVGPTGHRMTRDYPLNQDSPPCEKKDHPHHRSLWFNHGEMRYDGDKIANFWHLDKDRVVHKKYVKTDSDGKVATLVTENAWVTEARKTLCTDTRTLRFAVINRKWRGIDFDITIKAVEDIVFGDTKEGTFGLRVPGSMDTDAKKRNPAWGGTIINALGDKDGATWAKRADWVDYSGPVEDAQHGRATVGMTVMNHPSSFRYPTYWHVRDYGLFAANPFGVHDFENKKDERPGEHAMKKGDEITLRYRILLHEGPADPAVLRQAFEGYGNAASHEFNY